MAIWEKALGPDHPKVASSLGNLGGFALEQGKPREALKLLERAVRIYDAHDGVQENEASKRLTFARALVATGGDMARARLEAAKAVEAFREAGDRKKLAEAEAFQKENGAEK